ncbi:Protein of unknown function [Gryllus bimaculatus]|nr:Protein of unknown function [Gryllus bimaculatus]
MCPWTTSDMLVIVETEMCPWIPSGLLVMVQERNVPMDYLRHVDVNVFLLSYNSAILNHALLIQQLAIRLVVNNNFVLF